MKLDLEPTNKVEMQGTLAQNAYGMAQNAKAFMVLSSKLYSDKIAAVIREYSTNAVDSHIEAGCPDKPIEVHLPTDFEPYFYVKDTGTGLDHDQVFSVFATYFESTKNNSDAFNGCYGLGNKAGFAYSGNFTITAIKNNVKRVYSSFIDDDGVPSIVKMSENSTNEDNGVTVTIPVESKDFYQFCNTAKNIYKHFTVKPNIVGANIEIPDFDYTQKDVIPGVHLHNGRNKYVRMANVAYPIDMAQIDNDLNYTLSGVGFIIDLPNGAVHYPPSREALEYTDKSKKIIKDKINNLIDTFIKDTVNTLNGIPSKIARAIAFKTHVNKSNMLRLFRSSIIKQTNLETLIDSYGDFKKIYNNSEVLKKYNIRAESFYINTQYNSTERGYIPIVATNSAFYPNSTFIVHDENVGCITKIKNNYRDVEHDGKKFVVLMKADKELPVDYTSFFNEIGNPPDIMKSSDFKVVKKERVHNSLKNIIENSGHGWTTSATQFNDTDTYYYVNMVGQQIISDHNYEYKSHILGLLSIAGVSKIYGIRKKDMGAIGKNWVEFTDYVKTTIDSKTDTWYDTIVANHHGTISYAIGLSIPSSSPLHKYAKMNKLSNVTAIYDAAKHMNRPAIRDAESRLQQDDKKISDKYPLLQLRQHWMKSANEKYINLIEKEGE